MDESPTTEPNSIYESTALPETPEVRRGVKFILDVSQLRWKLWRKAKLEAEESYYGHLQRLGLRLLQNDSLTTSACFLSKIVREAGCGKPARPV